MSGKQDPERIKQAAMQLDEALENMDIEKVISLLHEDFELEMLGTVLKGKEGARKGFNWLLEHVDGIRLDNDVRPNLAH